MTHLTPTAALKPCPFCGDPVTLEECDTTRDPMYGERRWWGIACRSTKNHGGTCAVQIHPQASPEAAVTRWNTRTAPALATHDEAEREAFEAWIRNRMDRLSLERSIGEDQGYTMNRTNLMWSAWQARAALDKAGDGVAWTVPELVVGRTYESASHGHVEYRGTDWFYGEMTHRFKTSYGDRYWLPKSLKCHLEPCEAPAPAPQASADDARDAARWRAFRSRDNYEDLCFTSFQDMFEKDADSIIDQAIAALQRKEG